MSISCVRFLPFGSLAAWTMIFSTNSWSMQGVSSGISVYSDFFQVISGFLTSLTVNACSVAPSGSSFAMTTSR